MAQDEKYPHALPQGTILAGQYVIEKALGQGGFGITYKATDHKTGESVAVKEFFPDSMAQRATQTTVTAFSGERGESFAYGKECFLQEAETLAQFIGNEHIVRVFSYFEENGTAYFVMEFIEGTSFDQYMKERGGKLPYEEAERILLPVIEALAAVHAKGIVHRDVTPDNIYITKDGTVKLLDFGAARYSLGDKSRSLDVVLKHGFAPKEQYTRHGRQGAFTDVYTVGASFYFAITGKRPPDSIDRMDEDELIPPSSLVRIPPEKEDAILTAMSVQPANRYQTMVDFREALMRAPGAGVQNSGIQAMQNTGTPPVAMPHGTNMQAASGAVQSGMQSGEQTFQPQPVQQRVFTAAQQSAQPVSAPQIPQSASQPIPVQQISRNALQPEPVPQPVPEPVYIQQPNVQAQPAPIPQNVGVQPIPQPTPVQVLQNVKPQQPVQSTHSEGKAEEEWENFVNNRQQKKKKTLGNVAILGTLAGVMMQLMVIWGFFSGGSSELTIFKFGIFFMLAGANVTLVCRDKLKAAQKTGKLIQIIATIALCESAAVSFLGFVFWRRAWTGVLQNWDVIYNAYGARSIFIFALIIAGISLIAVITTRKIYPSDRTAMRTEETTPIEAKPENAISFPREITWENCDYECHSDGTAVLKKARIVAGAVTIPATVEYHSRTFRVTSIEREAFCGCSLTSITIPAGVTEIGDRVFYNCSSLTSIELPDSVTSIGTWAFNRCRSLTSIKIPDGVTFIGNGVFQGCSSLTSIVIPDGVTFIGDYAFYSCSSLTTVIYGGSQMSLNEFLGLF